MSVLPMPPSPGGTIPQQLASQYAYLFQMVQQLNAALSALDGKTYAPAAAPAAAQRAKTTQQYDSLRAMIVKTASTLKTAGERLEGRLHGTDDAAALAGYMGRLSAYLENHSAPPRYEGLLGKERSRIAALEKSLSAGEASLRGKLRWGIVRYEGDVPVYGVAVGENLSVTETDGTIVVQPRGVRAVFTEGRLGLWRDGTELASLTGDGLHLARAAAEEMTVGAWHLGAENGGLCLRWGGGTDNGAGS